VCVCVREREREREKEREREREREREIFWRPRNTALVGAIRAWCNRSGKLCCKRTIDMMMIEIIVE
jgi:hypothetical protein